MITVTRLSGQVMAVNAELIKFVESTPDTVITLTTGDVVIVKESVDVVHDRVVAYRKQIGGAAPAAGAPEGA